MPKADDLVRVVKLALDGDTAGLKEYIEDLSRRERSQKHFNLADRLNSLLANSSSRKFCFNKVAHGLLFEVVPEKKFEDLVLDNQILKICRELIEEQKKADLLHSCGLEPRNRILLTGLPGNGKTSLAEAIAADLGYSFFIVRYEELIGSYLGETASRLQQIFECVETQKCVLFFDEFDAVGKERGDTQETGEIKRIVSSLLMQMDKLPSSVVIITATNHPELLDRAVWRRFQLRFDLKPPNDEQINDHIALMERKTEINFNYEYDYLCEELSGYSFSEIEEFCLDIARRAILEDSREDAGEIVSEKLEQWKSKVTPDKI